MDVMGGSGGRQSNKSFAGLVVIFCGDFKQILPVTPKGIRHDIVHHSLCSSRQL